MDRGVRQIVTPQGDVLVVMPLAHFERLSAAAVSFMLSDAEDRARPPASEPDLAATAGFPAASFPAASLATAGLAMSSASTAAPAPVGPAAAANDGAGEPVPVEVSAAIAAGVSPLEAWRRYRQVSQSALARAAGVSRFTVMRIESAGVGAGNRQSRRLLAAALDIPLSAI